MQNPSFIIDKDDKRQYRIIQATPDTQTATFIEFEQAMREKVRDHFFIDLKDEAGPEPYKAETPLGQPTWRYRVPAVVGGEKKVLDLAGSTFKQLREQVEWWIVERKRLACLPPTNPRSKRYQQRQARKRQRKK